MEPKDTIPDGPAEPPVQVEAQVQAVEPSATEPVVEPAPAPVAESGAPATPGKPRPRGRTTLLIAAAAVLGIVGGTAVGYGVQADRAPTPLPALSQPNLAYPAKALPADKVPDPLPVSQDRQRKTEGDLRELLVSKPSGWNDRKQLALDDGWMSVDTYARDFQYEDRAFEYLLESDIRRVAAATWTKGRYRTANVWLVQFRSGTRAGAVDHAEEQLLYMTGDDDVVDSDLLKGSSNGRCYVYKADLKSGYMPIYRARAVVQRGDIMADINMFDTRPISKKDIWTLAERQLERL
ncbi:hypothetical protein OHA59_20720 [Streptomyces sp. NBC_01589]|uniref:hypothetical protein n=1 Tax=Streptomyces sp. NBC_01589 TaxID=2975886 RepID=UPI0038646621